MTGLRALAVVSIVMMGVPAHTLATAGPTDIATELLEMDIVEAVTLFGIPGTVLFGAFWVGRRVQSVLMEQKRTRRHLARIHGRVEALIDHASPQIPPAKLAAAERAALSELQESA